MSPDTTARLKHPIVSPVAIAMRTIAVGSETPDERRRNTLKKAVLAEIIDRGKLAHMATAIVARTMTNKESSGWKFSEKSLCVLFPNVAYTTTPTLPYTTDDKVKEPKMTLNIFRRAS